MAFIALLFFVQRIRWRRRKRLGKKHPGFYPSAAVLAISFLSLQTLIQPEIQHTLEEKVDEVAEEDDEAGPDDPTANFNRQLKRIRNGEQVDDLKVPLPFKTSQLANH